MFGTAIRIAMHAAFGRDAAMMAEKILGRPSKAVVRQHDAVTNAAPPTEPGEPTRQMRRWEERRLAKKVLRGKK